MALTFTDKFFPVLGTISSKMKGVENAFIDKTEESMTYIEKVQALASRIKDFGGTIDFDNSTIKLNSQGVPTKNGKFISNKNIEEILKKTNKSVNDRMKVEENGFDSVGKTLSGILRTLLSLLAIDTEILRVFSKSATDETEEREDRERQDRFDELRDEPRYPRPSGVPSKQEKFLPIQDVSLSELITAALVAPFAYRFVKGFLKEITDELLEVTPAGVFGAIALARPTIVAIPKAVMGSIGALRAAFNPLISGLASATGSILKFLGPIGGLIRRLSFITTGISNAFSSIGVAISKIAPVLATFSGLGILNTISKIAWPITVLISLYDGIQAFMDKEGSIVEKTLAGLSGILESIIGAPLNLLKSGVAYILMQMGFDKQAEVLNQFSFTDLIRSLFEGLYSTVVSMKDYVVSMFTWDEKVDAIEGDKTFFRDLIDDAIVKTKEFFQSLFSFIPSLDDVKASIRSIIPESLQWIIPGIDETPTLSTEKGRSIQVTPTSEQPIPIETGKDGADKLKTEMEEAKKRYLEMPEGPGPDKQQAKAEYLQIKKIYESTVRKEERDTAIKILAARENQSAVAIRTQRMDQNSITVKETTPTLIRGGDNVRGGDTYNTGGNMTTNITTITDPAKSLRSSAR